jgi:hypothetical protein
MPKSFFNFYLKRHGHELSASGVDTLLLEESQERQLSKKDPLHV